MEEEEGNNFTGYYNRRSRVLYSEAYLCKNVGNKQQELKVIVRTKIRNKLS